jgi:hypothetical protein
MTAVKENLKRISDSLIAKAPELYTLLRPGLKPEEIEEITKDLPFTLPEEIVELYQWHNGLSKEIGLYGWLHWESSFYFPSLTKAIEGITKIKINGNIDCFLSLFGIIHENGGDYYSSCLDRYINSIIILYDGDYYHPDRLVDYIDSNLFLFVS